MDLDEEVPIIHSFCHSFQSEEATKLLYAACL